MRNYIATMSFKNNFEFQKLQVRTQLTFTCSNLTVEKVENVMKYVQS